MTILLMDPTNRQQLTIGVVTPQASMALAYPGSDMLALTDSVGHPWWSWVSNALSTVGTHPSQLSRVIIVAGPGALTPLRMVATAAMGLALVHDTPIEWVPTDVACGAGYPHSILWTILGGRRHECIVGLVRTQGHHVERLIDPITMPINTWQTKATQLSPQAKILWANHHPNTPLPSDGLMVTPLQRMQQLTQWVSQGHTLEQVPHLQYVYPAI